MRTQRRMVQGTEVLIEQGGEGPSEGTLVFLHGWPDTPALWDETVAALAPRWRCVRFALPGYGAAAPERLPDLEGTLSLIEAVIEAVSPHEPVTLVLHDWGAVFGYQVAMRQPRRVARVVGVDVGDTIGDALWRSWSPSAKAGVMGYQLFLAVAGWIGGGLGDRHGDLDHQALRAPGDPATIHAGVNWPYRRAWTGGLKAAVPVDLACPVLFVYGERKPFLFHAPGWAARIAARPGSEVHALDCGHWVMVQRAARFHALVGDWLAAGAPHEAESPAQASAQASRTSPMGSAP